MTRIERVGSLIQGESHGGPGFLPLLGEFLASLRQQTVSTTFTDPSMFFNSLRDARHLLGLEADLVFVHPASLIEMAGAQVTWEGSTPQLPSAPWHETPLSGIGTATPPPSVLTAIEVVKRLSLADADVLRGVILMGPLAFGRLLMGEQILAKAAAANTAAEDVLDAATGILLQIVRACGEIGIDVLAIYDDWLPELAAGRPDLVDLVWTPLANLAGYYESRVVLASAARTSPDESLLALEQLRPHAFVSDDWQALTDQEPPCVLGMGLTAEQFASGTELATLPTGRLEGVGLVSSVAPLTTYVAPGAMLGVRHWVESLGPVSR